MTAAAAAALAVVALGAAAAVLPAARGRPSGRLRRALSVGGPPDTAAADPVDERAGEAALERRRILLRRAALMLAVAASGAVFGLVPGLGGGLVAAVVADRLLGRLEPAAVRDRRARMVEDLPALADLLAVTTRAGVPTTRALSVCATAVGGPLGAAVGRVATTLSLGADPVRAWSPLLEDPVTAPLAVTMIRAASRGLAPTGGLRACAGQARRSRAVTAARRAQSVGVSAAAPLGLCFLPAFVLIAVVPTVVGGLALVLG